MNQIDRLKTSLEKERKLKQLILKLNRENKRKILAKLKELEEEIKDIMFF